MDTVSLVSLLIAIGAGLVLALCAAIEASNIMLARRRLRGITAPGLVPLMRTYVRERQRLLRHLRAGVSVSTVTMTSALIVLFDGVEWTRVLLAAAVTVVLISSLRSASRIVTLSRPEGAAARLEAPARALQLLLRPLSFLLSAPTAVPLRALGLRGTSEAIDPAEELVGTLEAADEDATLIEERRMIRGVLEMSDQTVRELMTPRTDVTAVSTEASFGDVMRLVSKSGFSRIPLYEESLDRIVGVIYAKDLLAYVQNGNVTPHLADIARPPYVVPETKRANELLADLRRDQVHMAIAVDEYGGTAGVITVEDLVEEIVGAIEDEYDKAVVDVTQISETEAIVDASLTIDELNELFETQIHSEDFDTIGGLIVTELGRLAVPGDEVVVPTPDDLEEDEVAVRLRVMSILGRRIKKVNVQRYEPSAEGSPERAAEAV
ncbi:MAG: HlyC/CorC family transporter [Dehalococcoidia bacterium]|nr:HlyC/CorC family transporter [Dehalococcoidia bacterium]